MNWNLKGIAKCNFRRCQFTRGGGIINPIYSTVSVVPPRIGVDIVHVGMVEMASAELTPAAFPHPVRTEWKILAQLKVDNPSITQEECAKQIGVNPNTIRLWVRNPLYQSFENWFISKNYESMPVEVRKRREDVQEELDEFAQEMLGRLKDIVETSHDNKLIAQIGFDALDRANYRPLQKEGSRPINIIFTPEMLNELQRRRAEVVEGEAVVVGQVAEGAR